jgi:hypothetical protein
MTVHVRCPSAGTCIWTPFESLNNNEARVRTTTCMDPRDKKEIIENAISVIDCDRQLRFPLTTSQSTRPLQRLLPPRGNDTYQETEIAGGKYIK